VPDTPYTDAGLAAVDGQQELWQALSMLPPRQRAVLVLRYYEQRSDDEIADVLGISRSTVRSQASRGLEKLRGRSEPTVAAHTALTIGELG